MSTRMMEEAGYRQEGEEYDLSCNRGVITLLELLRFYAEEFLLVHNRLDRIASLIELNAGVGLNSEDTQTASSQAIKEFLAEIRPIFEHFNLTVCVKTVDHVFRRLSLGPIPPSDLYELQRNIRREIASRVFLSISPEKHAYFAEPVTRWESIIRAFPDSQEDIEEMNKCFALARYTAAVFHSLLVVEHGLIKLGHHIGVTDPKPGWDATYKHLSWLLNNRASIPTDLDFNFLEQTKARLDSMKLAWRNKVNHAAGRLVIEKSGFTDFAAEEIIIACRSFMRHLAEGLPS